MTSSAVASDTPSWRRALHASEALLLAGMPASVVLETVTFRRPLRYAVYAAVGAAIVGLPRLGRLHPLAAMARLAATVPLVVFIFDGILAYVPALTSRRADDLFIAIDRRIFGVDPTLWAARFIHPALTEWFQIAYAAFYLLPPVVAGTLYLQRRQRECQVATFAFVYTFFLNFVSYFALPAIGPRFTLHDPSMASVEMPGLFFAEHIRAALIAATGPSYDCFPSGHTDVTLCALGLAWRFERRLFAVLLPVGASIIVSTIYLRYHYAIDLAAGAAVGAFALLTASAVQRRVETAVL